MAYDPENFNPNAFTETQNADGTWTYTPNNDNPLTPYSQTATEHEDADRKFLANDKSDFLSTYGPLIIIGGALAAGAAGAGAAGAGAFGGATAAEAAPAVSGLFEGVTAGGGVAGSAAPAFEGITGLAGGTAAGGAAGANLFEGVNAGPGVSGSTVTPSATGTAGEASSGLLDSAGQTLKDVWGNPIGKELIKTGVKAGVSSLFNGGGGSGDMNAQLAALLAKNNFGAATVAPLVPAVSGLSGSHGPSDPAGIIASMNKPAPDITPANVNPAVSGKQTGAVRFGTTPLMHF